MVINIHLQVSTTTSSLIDVRSIINLTSSVTKSLKYFLPAKAFVESSVVQCFTLSHVSSTNESIHYDGWLEKY